jgi:hypothetical protein
LHQHSPCPGQFATVFAVIRSVLELECEVDVADDDEMNSLASIRHHKESNRSRSPSH